LAALRSTPFRVVVRVDGIRSAGGPAIAPSALPDAHRGTRMSRYFDALIRSSGMSIGRARPALTQLKPAAIEGDTDGGTTDTEAAAVRPASTPHEALSPAPPDVVARTQPPRVPGLVDRDAHEEEERAPTLAHDTTERAAHSPQKPYVHQVESSTPDLGQTL